MPNLPISGLPAAASLALGDLFAIDQVATNTTKKLLASAAATGLLDNEKELEFVQCRGGYNITDAVYLDIGSQGLICPDEKWCAGYGMWMAPQKFKALLMITAVWLAGGNGGAYLSNTAMWAACGEDYDTDSVSAPPAGNIVVPVLRGGVGPGIPGMYNCVQPLLAAPSVGDIFSLIATRDSDSIGLGAADTVGDIMVLAGWTISYTSQSYK